ncbi:MAG: betaine/proline/choline family ABC transporter ATP-binding protein [Candidatus Methanofastidiosa archaeon]|nr:betaine/proline/choline family ABC transporter ATP-binding protein [Candidatus Methanofastidiosa archaeon]
MSSECLDSLKFEHVTKIYKESKAIDDVSFEICKGELFVILGSSGSGKTTTLRLINRLIDPDQGAIYLNGQDTKDMDPVNLRRRIGYVIQQIGLFPHMTVKENIGLIPRLEKWKDQDISNRIDELLSLVALPPDLFRSRYPNQLSGGQQQRVGLARALVMDPPLLLMDEPFGALDPLLRMQLQNEFLSIKTKLDKTIVFVTHDIEESFILADRIGVMHGGKMLQIGTPSELLFEPENEIVSKIIGTENKFKALRFLEAKDVMMPLDKNCMIEVDISCEEAINKMISEKNEVCIIKKSNSDIAQIALIDLLNRKNKDESIFEVGKKLIIVSPHDSLSSIISILKSSKEPSAVVMEREKVLGIVMINSVLMELV